MDTTLTTGKSKGGNLIYYGLILYTMVFYSQIAARFPFLAPFRIEFLIGACLVFVSFVQILNGTVSFKENKLNLAALLFLSVALLTIPFAVVKTRALNTFISLFKFFAIYLMIITTIDNEDKLKNFIYVYLIMICLLFVQPFLLSLQGKGFIYNNHMMRLAGATGYFGHPNQLGAITAANLPFFYYWMKYTKSTIGKLTALSLLIISIRVIMLTQSRTAFVGLTIFVFYIWLTSRKKLLSFFAIILSCITIWNFAPQETKERFLTLANLSNVVTYDRSEFTKEDHSKYGSMASRWILIKRALIVFSENPVLGVGLDCFASVNGRRWGLWFPPHSTYVQALAEMGLLGFIAFFYVIILTFKNLNIARRTIANWKEQNTFISYIVDSLTAYLLVRLAVSFFGIELYANYWWLAGGLSLVILRVIKKHSVQSDLNNSAVSL
jgi:O-antigen ligase